jgi:hypothetical protein
MSYTNLSQNLSNMNTLSDLLNLANTTTDGAFWAGIYWMIIVIAFISSVGFGWEIAFGLSFFGGMIMGLFLVTMGLISMTVFGATEAILIFVLIYLLYSSKSNP